ncbi:TrkH family potassium uptake protein [Clavibacter michiganensis]|uniref:Ktr system potassium uptake protein B n=1 Tax=Clavibacter michiganensis TaxID=28447 RepID=A0A251YIU3_9MICO|nr:potassium transporter TrkG [Clavibacter michiganensis]OUE24147.1 Ktr system potassium uptake protein B [Clavibacter michiganensis]
MIGGRDTRADGSRGPFPVRLSSGSLLRRSPALVALGIFLLAVVVFAVLLSLPAATADGSRTPLVDAVFTAVSAMTVTGLVTVDTATHWSFLGQVVILAGVQVGGLGIVTIALLLSRAVTHKLGVRGRIMAQQGIGTDRLGEVQSLLKIVVLTTFGVEAVLAAALVPAFIVRDGDVLSGIWHGVFYAVSAFNNAGFVTHAGGLAQFGTDPFIIVPLMVGVFIGSLGFPVFLVLIAKRARFRAWNLHAKLTVTVTSGLLLLGAVLWTALEWSNAATIGDLPAGEKLVHGLFASTMMRSGGFAISDTAASNPVTLLATDALMFVGGGSASTAGGIKVTTIALLFLAIAAEGKGDKHVRVFRRTVPDAALRVAISVIFLGATLVLIATALIMTVSDAPLDRILFEVISAFATCGLSVGLSEELDPFGKYVLAALMFAGRVGPIGLASALAIRRRTLLYEYPEDRPVIG